MKVFRFGNFFLIRGSKWQDVLSVANEVSRLVNKSLEESSQSITIGNFVCNIKNSQPEKLKFVLEFNLTQRTSKAKLTKKIFIKLLKRKD